MKINMSNWPDTHIQYTNRSLVHNHCKNGAVCKCKNTTVTADIMWPDGCSHKTQLHAHTYATKRYVQTEPLC